jgi:RimJ/RimL family protein N-acetyltransferase
MTEIPTLETERLILRPWRDSDLGGFADIVSDPERAKFIGGALSRNDAWRKLAAYVGHWHLRGYGPFALEERASGNYVGYCGPWYPLGWPEPEISWGLNSAALGRGYATEAARCTLGYAYQTLGWTTAVSVIANDNTPSMRVAERLGAKLDGATDIRGLACQIWRHPAPSKMPTATQNSGA